MIDLKNMDILELQMLHDQVEKALSDRRNEVHHEMVTNLLDAAKALLAEFPTTSADVEVECPDCDVCFDIDLLEYLTKLVPKNFRF